MINCQWSDEELDRHMPAEAKKYIADNNIQLYTINAIDKAIEIGMGKRTNTILQSAFFALNEQIMPYDQALDLTKAAAKKSYEYAFISKVDGSSLQFNVNANNNANGYCLFTKEGASKEILYVNGKKANWWQRFVYWLKRLFCCV